MECRQVDDATRDDLDLLRQIAQGDQDALDTPHLHPLLN